MITVFGNLDFDVINVEFLEQVPGHICTIARKVATLLTVFFEYGFHPQTGQIHDRQNNQNENQVQHHVLSDEIFGRAILCSFNKWVPRSTMSL